MNSGIKQYPFKAGLPHEFEITRISDIFKCHKELLTTPHRNEFYNIFWFQKGSPVHLVDFNPVQIEPNTFLFISKSRVHRFDLAGEYDGLGLFFTDSFFCRNEKDSAFLHNSMLFNDLLDTPSITLQSSEAPLIHLFEFMSVEAGNPVDCTQHDILKNLLNAFLLLAERERKKAGFSEIRKGPDLDLTLSFKEILEKEFRGTKTVSAYAMKTHVSEKRLNQATSRVLGKTPKELIDERTLQEAKRLLVHSTLSIKEIGFILGFPEPTNFIKYFRKHTQVTPVRFRDEFLPSAVKV
jgi:AraC family transcriptional activator of pobA